MSTIYGRPLFIGSGKPRAPEIFGTGADGDLYIPAGETVTLPVPVPHQSVVEMNYTSITIEAGGTLTTSDPNAGLVLRCQGDCTIHGTIDQSGKAPKTNPDSTYQYPEELQCGAGGNGGAGASVGSAGGAGGTGMAARAYGGGYGGGGGGGSGLRLGGAGGSVDAVTILTPDSEMFVGGGGTPQNNGTPGTNGGGGGGGGERYSGTWYAQGAGGTGPGAAGGAGQSNRGNGGGGAGNLGGGVLMLYAGGTFFLDGTIDCSGKGGGAGGSSNASSGGSAGGGGGGGGGGGSIYIVHNGVKTVNGTLAVHGGAGGAGGAMDGSAAPSGTAGGIGTATVKQYEETA